jgi:2-desacetyl-2-hydroxyethyl bacteriochlorophyllide A dehydrogenase
VKTLVLTQPGQFDRTDSEAPGDPGVGQALIRIHRVGICGTDLHAFRGRQPFFDYPRILGHELGAEVLAMGDDVRGLQIGDLVAVEPYLNCATCLPCSRGRVNCCESLQVLGVHTDGGMREEILVPAHKLHRSASLQLEQLALVETLGIGAHAVDRAQLQEDEIVLVVGAGPIGLAVAQFATIAGAQVHVLEPNEKRRNFAHDLFQLAGSYAPGDDAPPATCVFDATGNRAAMEAAFDLPAASGRLVLVGFQLDKISFANPDFHRRELTIMSSRNSTPADFTRIIGLMESGQIDTAPWITHRAEYDNLIESFPSWLEPETDVVKAMLELT